MSPEGNAPMSLKPDPMEKVAMTGGAGNVVVRRGNVASYERRGYKCRQPEAKKGKRSTVMDAKDAAAKQG